MTETAAADYSALAANGTDALLIAADHVLRRELSRRVRENLIRLGLVDDGQTAAIMQAVLADLADPRSAFGWHRDYADVLRGAWRDYLVLEAAASQIQGYEAQQIPGLLQTRAYARGLAKTDPGFKDDAARDRAADAVLTRQLAVLEAERRPDIHLIIGEAALHQQVGGSEVMHQQLRQVARVAGDGGAVMVQVLPFESGAHAAAGDGSLTLLHVTAALGLGVVHLGGVGGGVCVEGADDLGAYAEVFDQLRAFAPSPAQSALLLRGLIDSDSTPHSAHVLPGETRGWEVSWLAGRRLDRNAAITAMVLADVTGSGDMHPGHRLWIHVEGWAAELGLTAPYVLTRTTRAPSRTDAGKNALPSDPEAAG